MCKQELYLATINRIPTLTGSVLTAGTIRIEGINFVGSVDYHYNSGKVTLNGILSSEISSLKDREVSLSVVLHKVAGRVEMGAEYFPSIHDLVLIHTINNPDVEPF